MDTRRVESTYGAILAVALLLALTLLAGLYRRVGELEHRLDAWEIGCAEDNGFNPVVGCFDLD